MLTVTVWVSPWVTVMAVGTSGTLVRVKEVVTVAEFKPRFIDGYAKANRQKASGIAHKEAYLRLYVLPLLGTKRLDAITDEDIQRLKATMERKNAKTVNNALSVLSKMLKVALEWKVIDRLPATIRLLKPGSARDGVLRGGGLRAPGGRCRSRG